MPEISKHLLYHMADSKVFTHLFLTSDPKTGFGCSFSVGDFQLPAREEDPFAEADQQAARGEETLTLERKAETAE